MRVMEIEFIIAAPPEAEPAQLEQIPELRLAFANKGVQVTAAPDGATGYWFTRLGVKRQSDWPAAPYRLDAAAAGDAYWLCADPIGLQIERDRLLFDPQGPADLSLAEAQAFIATLNTHFAPDGLQFQAPAPGQWLLRVPRVLDLAAAAPWDASGQPAALVLPRGADAAWARRLANEAQMLLHQAPANTAREARRLPPVNSLWLWGGGRRETAGVVSMPHATAVASSALYLRGLAQAAGARGVELSTSWPATRALLGAIGADKVLIDLTEIPQDENWINVLRANWLKPAAEPTPDENSTVWISLLTHGLALRTRLYHRDLFHFFGRKSLAQYIHKRQN